MISRCHPGILGRSITSGTTLPSSLHRVRTDERKDVRASTIATARTTVSAKTVPPAAEPDIDPWAGLFDDVSDSMHGSRRSHRLPSGYFSSRPGPKTFFSSNTPNRQRGRRDYGTDAKPLRDTWDHLFDGLDDTPPAGGRVPNIPPMMTPSADRRPQRRKAMTAREISAFDDMFDMIFAAVHKQAQHPQETRSSYPTPPSAELSPPAASTSEPAPAPTTPPPAIGRAPSREMADFFGKLRSHSNRMRRTSEDDELLDRKKEEIQLCDTDQQLLAWAAREVFHEPEPAPAPDTPSSSELSRYLSDPTYPHVLAHLMHIFRTKYRAPHTALALFGHAKRRSIHSYVFGCTTPAYNERIAALWELEGWAGLDTVEAALAEMRANGVQADRQTRVLVEGIRTELGERMLEQEENDSMSEVWDTLERVEVLVKRKEEHRLRKGKLNAKQLHRNEGWKSTENPRLGEDRLTLQP